MRRRTFVCGSASAAVSLFAPKVAFAGDRDFWIRDRELWLRRPETLQECRVTFWSEGRFDPDSYVALCYMLRDAEESITPPITPRLLNLLFAVQRWGVLLNGRSVPADVLSGYRTRDHNNRTEGAVVGSQHTLFRAADCRFPGFTPKEIARMASHFGWGGVGTYPTFTHIDVGPVRHWIG